MKDRIITWISAAVILIGVIGFIVLVKDGIQSENEVTGENLEQNLITIGFSQVGAESDWRTANSISIKKTFSVDRGYNLIFDDAKQVQKNQIRAIRGFIQQDVDYIIFSPVIENGWDTVLEEAKLAGIPVIILDRQVNVKDESLYSAWVGSNFYLEGQKACEVLKQYVEKTGMEEVNIVNIQGTIGSTSQLGRTRALEDAVRANGWHIITQESGEYTEAKAYEVMKKLLDTYDNINVVYCENDNEAFGVLDAIKDAGKTVGEGGDIQIISFDATRGGLRDTLAGKILVDVECNPLQGAEIENIIHKLMQGEQIEKKNYLEEQIFTSVDGIDDITIQGEEYEVQTIDEDIIREREY